MENIKVTQNLPSLFTIEGRQYELKNIAKTTKYTIGDEIPTLPFIPSVVYGEPEGAIVPTNQNGVHIFLSTPNPIIPLAFMYIENNAGGFVSATYDSKNYTWCEFSPLLTNIFHKTVQAQNLIQFLQTSSNNTLAMNNIKISKNDFCYFVAKERILWTFNNALTLSPLVVGNESIWNERPVFVLAPDFYVSMSFTYLELV